jgi:hypothetical protein
VRFASNAVHRNENPRAALRPELAAVFWAWADLDFSRRRATASGALVAIAARRQVTSPTGVADAGWQYRAVREGVVAAAPCIQVMPNLKVAFQ